jgi:hypothetical protein
MPFLLVEPWGGASHHLAKNRKCVCECLCHLWSYSLLVKLPGFNHGDSTLMIYLILIKGPTFKPHSYLLYTSQWGLNFNAWALGQHIQTLARSTWLGSVGVTTHYYGICTDPGQCLHTEVPEPHCRMAMVQPWCTRVLGVPWCLSPPGLRTGHPWGGSQVRTW